MDTKQYAPFGVAVLVGVIGFALGDWRLMAFMLAAAIACGGVVQLDTRWGVLATSVLGLGSSAYLFSRKLESAGGPALCNVNDVINCDVVNNSAASEMFGVPIALLGSGFFLGVAIATQVARQPAARLYPTITALAGLGSLYSLYLAFESSRLGAVCVMCITIYICNGILVWAGLKGMKEVGQVFSEQPEKIPGSSSFITVAATFFIVTLVGLSTWSDTKSATPDLPQITGTPDPAPAQEPAPAPTAAPTEQAATAPAPAPQPAPSSAVDPAMVEKLAGAFTYAQGPVELSGTEAVLGDPNAPYMVVEFADFGCPHCAEASVALKQLVQQVPEVQVRFRPFVLSGACNPALQGQEGVERCRAAMASECANKQGKFWDYSSLVFQGQPDLSDNALLNAAQQTSLDLDAWRACMVDRKTVEAVVEHSLAGARAGVKGTPALFVKGVAGDRWVDVCWGPEAVLALVDLARKGVDLPTPTQSSCYP
ncbi:MAG: thioredoxin domain-containing protein [Myxococcales bacterium]|nr:thioredoxin domain-containing protein [Myxococcales bacterium]